MAYASKLYQILKKCQSNEDFSKYEFRLLQIETTRIQAEIAKYCFDPRYIEVHCRLKVLTELEEADNFLLELENLQNSLRAAIKNKLDLPKLLDSQTITDLYDGSIFVLTSSASIRMIIRQIESLPPTKKLYVSAEIKNNPFLIFDKKTRSSFLWLTTKNITSRTTRAINDAAESKNSSLLDATINTGIDELLISNAPYLLSREHLGENLLRFAQFVRRRETVRESSRRTLYTFVVITSLILCNVALIVLLFYIFNPLSTLYETTLTNPFSFWSTVLEFVLLPLLSVAIIWAQNFFYRLLRNANNRWISRILPIGFVQITIITFSIVAIFRPAAYTVNYITMWVFSFIALISSTFETIVTFIQKRNRRTDANRRLFKEREIIFRHIDNLTVEIVQILYLFTTIPITLFSSRLHVVPYSISTGIIAVALLLFSFNRWRNYFNSGVIARRGQRNG